MEIDEIKYENNNIPLEIEAATVDEDGSLEKGGGTVWTTSAHIITASIGASIMSASWVLAQLGWIFGPLVMLLFAISTYYISMLLSACKFRRNDTYMRAVELNLGKKRAKICGFLQYINLFMVSIGYIIAAAISMRSIERSIFFQKKGYSSNQCDKSSYLYMVIFGIVQIIFSQYPDIHRLWWLSVLAAAMFFTYSTIGLGLGIATVVGNGKIKGSLTGIKIGMVSEADKVFYTFRAVGVIAFAFSFSVVLIEIQGTLKAKPEESKIMKKATLSSVIVTTTFYMLCGCFGYAAFGDLVSGELLSEFEFNNLFWLLNIANLAIVIELIGGYQVVCQPLHGFIEQMARKKFPHCDFITNDIKISIPGVKAFNINLFRLVWRTVYVILTTFISMLFPFLNDLEGLCGALVFWPLTAYFPIEMYIARKSILKWSTKWIGLKILCFAYLIITIAAAAGFVESIVHDTKFYKPFQTYFLEI